MADKKKRRVFETGHHRKFLVVVDDSPEFEVALFFAARVASRTGGRLAMLCVNEPMKTSGWFDLKDGGSGDMDAWAKEHIAAAREKLQEMGVKKLRTEAIIRNGDTAEEILKVIERDQDIAVLVLGASVSGEGPGPLVSSLAAGARAGQFPIPIYIVPGDLTLDEVAALA